MTPPTCGVVPVNIGQLCVLVTVAIGNAIAVFFDFKYIENKLLELQIVRFLVEKHYF
jgi:hypothetical protein